MPRALGFAFFGLVLLAFGLGQPRISSTPSPEWNLSVHSLATLGEYEVVAEVTIPEGYYQDADSPFLTIEPQSNTVAGLGPLRGSPLMTRDGKSSFQRQATLTRSFSVVSGGGIPTEWRVGWQICQFDGVCLLPGTQVLTAPVLSTPNQSPSSSLSFWWAIAGAILGGLILNIMPCVFPVLGLKTLRLATQTAPGRRLQGLGAFGGIVGGLSALGVATAVASSLGRRLDWGFTFQNPLFVGAIAVVFWVAVLQLWNLWKLPGYSISLFRGVGRPMPPWIEGLVLVASAAPCTAPLLGPAIGFALAQPWWQIPWFFVAAGVGFGLPTLSLALFPRLADLFPKPGTWMIVVERIAGLLLALTVVYLGWILTQQVGFVVVFRGVIALAAVTAIGFWGYRETWKPVVLGIGLAIFVIVSGLAFLGPGPRETPEATTKAPWVSFRPGLIESELRAGHPVFVDATAAWCATCQVNEWGILGQPKLLNFFHDAGVTLVRADYTVPDPGIHDWLASVERGGLPVYALYLPNHPVVLFPELLTEGNFVVPLRRFFGPAPQAQSDQGVLEDPSTKPHLDIR